MFSFRCLYIHFEIDFEYGTKTIHKLILELKFILLGEQLHQILLHWVLYWQKGQTDK